MFPLSPASTTCPECEGAGSIELDGDSWQCGVCLGDGYLLDNPWPGATIGIDHSVHGHSCPRCAPERGRRPLVFVDVETTGLDRRRHHVWEAAYVTEAGLGWVRSWQVSLAGAEHRALELSGYFDRSGHAPPDRNERLANARIGWRVLDGVRWAEEFMHGTAGATIAGSNPGFDDAFLTRWLHRCHRTPLWHHKPLDVTTWAAPLLGLPGSASLKHVAQELDRQLDGAVGYDPDAHHTAIYDAWLARQVYAVAAHAARIWTPAQPMPFNDLELDPTTVIDITETSDV